MSQTPFCISVLVGCIAGAILLLGIQEGAAGDPATSAEGPFGATQQEDPIQAARERIGAARTRLAAMPRRMEEHLALLEQDAERQADPGHVQEPLLRDRQDLVVSQQGLQMGAANLHILMPYPPYSDDDQVCMQWPLQEDGAGVHYHPIPQVLRPFGSLVSLKSVLNRRWFDSVAAVRESAGTYRIEMVFGPQARPWLMGLLEVTTPRFTPPSHDLAFRDWAGCPIGPKALGVSAMHLGLVSDALLWGEFCVNQVVHADVYPATVTLAAGLPKEAADRLVADLDRIAL